MTAGSIASQAGMGNANSPYTGLPNQTVVDNPFLTPTNNMMPDSGRGMGSYGGSVGGDTGVTDELMRLRQYTGGGMMGSGSGGY